jgi:hypothetical protein
LVDDEFTEIFLNSGRVRNASLARLFVLYLYERCEIFVRLDPFEAWDWLEIAETFLY